MDKYHGHLGLSDLNGIAAANVDQFYQAMGEHGWTKSLRYKDDNAWESDFEDSSRGGNDNIFADTCDLVYFCGHGDPYAIYFGTDHQEIPGGLPYQAHISEVKWGDQDMEWIVLDSCEVLKYKDESLYWWQRWDSTALTIHSGLHVMMGWDSVSLIYGVWKLGTKSRGHIFADKIGEGYTLWRSWHDATVEAKPFWDFTVYKAVMGYGKIYQNGVEILKYSEECPRDQTFQDPTWYADHGYTIGRGYSSWLV